MSNKILVLGATGNIGSHLIDLLKNKGADFLAGTSSNTREESHHISIDFADVLSIEKAMKGMDTLFMLMPTHPDMVQWGKNIVSSAQKSGIKHIVRLSAAIAKNDLDLDFMKKIREIDNSVINSGLNYTIIAPQFFMQNLSTLMADDYKNGTLYLPAGDGKLGWIDVRDIALVSMEILLNPEKYKNETLTITGTESLSYGEAVEQMNNILGKDTQYIAVPDDAAIQGMTEKQFPPFFIDVMMDLNHATVLGYAEELTDTVEKITGKKPISFKEFVINNKSVWS